VFDKNRTDSRRDFVIHATYWTLVALLVYLLVKYVLMWVMPILIGFLIAAMLNPVVMMISKRLKVGGKISAGIAIILFYVTVVSLLWVAGFTLWNRIVLIIADLPLFFTSFVDALKSFSAPLQSFLGSDNVFSDAAGGIISSISGSLISQAGTAGMGLPSLFAGFLFTVISSVFILLDYEGITKFIESHTPAKIYEITIKIKGIIKDTVLRYARAYTLLMLITFTQLTAAFYILGINNGTALAALIAVIDILPILGCGTVLLPWIVFLLLTGDYALALGLAVVYVIVTIVKNFLEPRIVGSHIGLHPAAMIACLCFGFFAGGVGGMLLTPCTVIVLLRLNAE
jgi:sporulation integral membrane protein YtvI